MNEFTKEELCLIRDSRCYHLDDNFPYEDALFMKLQSMIDNYCEHPVLTPEENELFEDKMTKRLGRFGGDMGFGGKHGSMNARNIRRLMKKFPKDKLLQDKLREELARYNP